MKEKGERKGRRATSPFQATWKLTSASSLWGCSVCNLRGKPFHACLERICIDSINFSFKNCKTKRTLLYDARFNVLEQMLAFLCSVSFPRAPHLTLSHSPSLCTVLLLSNLFFRLFLGRTMAVCR